MYPQDTIAAIATAPGVGGISIVRVSGPDSCKIARRIFRNLPGRDLQSHRLYVGTIRSVDGHTIDRGMCVLMRAPRSYTGEDVAEFHCHGGVLVSRAVLGAALAAGARPAARGEFTLRAFLNGKLDLAQAESVVDLISARTPAALRVAHAQLEGALSQAVESFRHRLEGIAARLEVAIDFSEEDVGELDRDSLESEITQVSEDIRKLGLTFERGRILRDGYRVAIVGKPNVGKSSLLNFLLKIDRAIVTPVPGTTRDVLEETLDLAGFPVVLVDTAGMRSSSDEVERVGIERTYREIEKADAAIVVLDGSRPLEAEDEMAIAATRHLKCILLINKLDLKREVTSEDVSALAERNGLGGCRRNGCRLQIAIHPRSTASPTPRRIAQIRGRGRLLALAAAGDFRSGTHFSDNLLVEASVKTGAGMDLLCEKLTHLVITEPTDLGHIIVTRERHTQALNAAVESLHAALGSLRGARPPELISVDVAAALDHLGEIVGRTSPEAVLDRIFSEFCIGK